MTTSDADFAVLSDEVAAALGRNARLVRRQRITIVVAVICVLASAGGLLAARFVKSPAQQAASAGPPTASVLTASVQRQVLSQTLILRGTITAAQEVQVAPATAGDSGSAAVVTAVRVVVGQPVKPGEVVLEVAGRPVIALAGSIPAYRDLKPGASGKDVTELQKALAQLGDYHGTASGTFDTGTKNAVTALYEHLGYDVPTTGGSNDAGDQQALQAAQNAVDDAQRAEDDLKRQMSAAASRPSPDRRAAPADPGQEPFWLQLQYLQRTLAQAEQARDELKATTGPVMPLAEFVFVPSFPARVETLTAEVGQTVTGSVVTLSTGRLQVTAQLAPDQAGLVKAGGKVTITSESLGRTIHGTLATVGAVTTRPPAGTEATGSDGAGAAGSSPVAPYIPISITPVSRLGTSWSGQDVRLNFTRSRTSSAVLVVPVSAVSTSADGTTSVTTLAADGKQTRVPVITGASADGFVQVTPSGNGSVTVGQKVVTGR